MIPLASLPWQAGVAVLLGCGLAMGAINNVAGAAGVVGLVGLEEIEGLDARQANATLRLSAVAIGTSGLLGFRSRGRKIPPRAWLYGLIPLLGAVAYLVVRPPLRDEQD